MNHKCYISFKTEDSSNKEYIQSDLDVDMIDKSLDEPIESDNDDYILRTIREDYLADSTVTIHLIGQYSAELLGKEEQRFIKRELQASLYNSQSNSRNGILGVVLPNVDGAIFKGKITCSTCDHLQSAQTQSVQRLRFTTSETLLAAGCPGAGAVRERCRA